MTEPLFESAMHCPECGCQFCPNCFGALCDCDTVFYRHDVSHCWEPSAAEEAYMAERHPTAMLTVESADAGWPHAQGARSVSGAAIHPAHADSTATPPKRRD